jgi:hypothetical protein
VYKKIIITVLLIVLLIVGIVYYEKTRDVYKAEKVHWTDVMKDISSNETKTKLLSHFDDTEIKYYNGKFIHLLLYLRQHVFYTKEDFLRSEDPEWIIYGLHLGRCGEFSIAYTALCLAFDVPARLTVHMGQDHMWTEVYVNGNWTHVDPTEGKINMPLLYNTPKPDGWGKPVGKDYPVYAFETDGSIIDVSERYIYVD